MSTDIKRIQNINGYIFGIGINFYLIVYEMVMKTTWGGQITNNNQLLLDNLMIQVNFIEEI